MDIHKVIGKISFKRKKCFILPNIASLDPITLYICNRDNDTPPGKCGCDRKMLAELNALVPEGRCEKVDRQQVRSIIGLKHRMRLGIDWSNLLANELRKLI